MNRSGYAYDDQGNALASISVEAYKVGDTSPTASTTTDSSGHWSFSSLAAGAYRIKLIDGLFARWLPPDEEIQVKTIVGTDGVTAPLADGSVTTAQLQDSSVTTAKIADSAVTNTKVAAGTLTLDRLATGEADNLVAQASITVDDTTAPTADTGSLATIVSGIANRLVAVTGEADWKDTPAKSLKDLKAYAESQVSLHLLQDQIDPAISETLSTTSTDYQAASLTFTKGFWLVYSDVNWSLSNGGTATPYYTASNLLTVSTIWESGTGNPRRHELLYAESDSASLTIGVSAFKSSGSSTITMTTADESDGQAGNSIIAIYLFG